MRQLLERITNNLLSPGPLNIFESREDKFILFRLLSSSAFIISLIFSGISLIQHKLVIGGLLLVSALSFLINLFIHSSKAKLKTAATVYNLIFIALLFALLLTGSLTNQGLLLMAFLPVSLIFTLELKKAINLSFIVLGATILCFAIPGIPSFYAHFNTSNLVLFLLYIYHCF